VENHVLFTSYNFYFSSTIFSVCLNSPASIEYKYNPALTS